MKIFNSRPAPGLDGGRRFYYHGGSAGKEDRILPNDLFPFDTLAIQKARRYLAVNAEPSIEAPAVLEPLLAELTGSGLQRLQKILPGVYQKLEQKKPDFFKKCLLETLKKSEGIFCSYPDQRASIFQEFSSRRSAPFELSGTFG